ncbi:MBL fold metallo-hydrolase [Anaerolentibacter hominis]|uniref:MBL fold metallo-hydrolase n=1 Tax=Anaerolentibacter hominis TaxID=3079009 RepID=UPI0031B885A9
MLRFFGYGSAFNTKLGCNSAFFQIGTDVIVFDQGGDVLPKMLEKNIFEGMTQVHFFITHMHGDHVGGLANAVLCLYSTVYRHKPDKIWVHFPNPKLQDFIEMQGVTRDKYTFCTDVEGEVQLDDPKEKLFYSFERTQHEPIFGEDMYGFDMEAPGKFHLFYSGDSSRINPKLMDIDKYTHVYHEVSMNPKAVVHTQFEKLVEFTKEFTPEQRKKVHLMHLEDIFDYEKARNAGFSIVCDD